MTLYKRCIMMRTDNTCERATHSLTIIQSIVKSVTFCESDAYLLPQNDMLIL